MKNKHKSTVNTTKMNDV